VNYPSLQISRINEAMFSFRKVSVSKSFCVSRSTSIDQTRFSSAPPDASLKSSSCHARVAYIRQTSVLAVAAFPIPYLCV
jgi:hypothetical protein